MEPLVQVQCPYCYELIELYVDPGTEGSFVEDDSLQATVTRAQ